jgi:hypothetical protein
LEASCWHAYDDRKVILFASKAPKNHSNRRTSIHTWVIGTFWSHGWIASVGSHTLSQWLKLLLETVHIFFQKTTYFFLLFALHTGFKKNQLKTHWISISFVLCVLFPKFNNLHSTTLFFLLVTSRHSKMKMILVANSYHLLAGTATVWVCK